MATVYAVDGSTRTVEPKNGKDFKLRELQEIVEGYIQVIYLTPGADKEVADEGPVVAAQAPGWGKTEGTKPRKIMVINEKGKMEGLARNEKATRIFQASFPGTRDFIVGPALVCDSEQVL